MHLFERSIYHMLVPSSSNIFDISGLSLKEVFIYLIYFEDSISLHDLHHRRLTGSQTHLTRHKKWKFPLRISSVTKPQFHVDLVTFTEEILMENFNFCAVSTISNLWVIRLLKNLFSPEILCRVATNHANSKMSRSNVWVKLQSLVI